ncbi:MAG: tetratricopeptide repeat protein, partial [Gemmatimonadetes bacterium]|nr:tetratricopeptide repeat protein [Gemmatimonadota bacterium]
AVAVGRPKGEPGSGAGPGTAPTFVAGALAGIAAFFGKAHAVVFLPALIAWLGLRSRGVRAPAVAFVGFAATGLLWALLIFRPFAADILDQSGRVEELYGAVPWLRSVPAALAELLWTLRASWLFHRIPVLGAVGLVFVFTTFFHAPSRRRRIADGTALLAFWFAAAGIAVTLLPYKAPRYFVPAAVPLIAVGALQLHEWWRRGDAHGAPLSRLAALGLGVVLGIVAVDVLIHVLSTVQDRALATIAPAGAGIADRCTAVLEWLRPPWTHVGLGAVAGAVGTWAVRAWSARGAGGGRAGSGAFGRREAAALAAAALLFQTVQFVDWIPRRTYAIEGAKASLDAITAPDAVIAGAFAPLLVQDGRRTGVPQFGAFAAGDLARHGATHVVSGSAADAQALQRADPQTAQRLTLVRQWPFRTRHVRALQLYRIRGVRYRLTAFERAAIALEEDRVEEALRELEAVPEPAPPDRWSLEAHARFLQGDLPRAGLALERALALAPDNPDDWFNLGTLRDRSGDPAGAREAWVRARELDPWDEPVREALARPSR